MNAPPSGGPFGGSGTWLWPVACIGYSPCHSSGSHSLPYALSYKHRKTSAVVRRPRRALWLSLVVRRQTRRSLWCEPCGVSRLLHALAFHDVDIRQTGWRQIKGEVLYFPPVTILDFNWRPETTHRRTLRRRLLPRPRRPPNRTLTVALRRDNYQVLLPPLLDTFVEASFNCALAALDPGWRHLDGLRRVESGHGARIALVESVLPLFVACAFPLSGGGPNRSGNYQDAEGRKQACARLHRAFPPNLFRRGQSGARLAV